MSRTKHAYPGPTGRRPLDGHIHVWRVGDKVVHWARSEWKGEVVEIGYCAVKVHWSDDVVSIVHPRDIEVAS